MARRGLIDRYRGDRIADLVWPRYLTMFAWHSRRVADVSTVGLSIGDKAIAGLAFGAVYWEVAQGLGLAIAGGTIGLVSQRYGASQMKRLDLAVKQSVWIAAGGGKSGATIDGLYAAGIDVGNFHQRRNVGPLIGCLVMGKVAAEAIAA